MATATRLFRSAAYETKPMIILLGWLGSKLRYFSKYEELWRGLGGYPVGMRPTILQTAVPPLADRALLRFMADVNRYYGSHCLAHGQVQPVLVHSLSNAGFLAFGTMLHLTSLLETLPQAAASTPSPYDDPPEYLAQPSSSLSSSLSPGAPADTRHPYLRDPATLATLVAFRRTLGYTSGIVVDSAPSSPDPDIWSRGVLSAALGRPADGIEKSHPTAVRALRSFSSPYLKSKPIERRYAEIQQAWLEGCPACPQLYLYSEADALIPPDDIRAFMRRQRERGVSVQSRCWPDSQHCEHYRTHPQEYAQLVRDFVQHCVTRGGAGWRGGGRAEVWG